MKLNQLEFALMNNPVRAASQRYLETPLLIGPDGTLAGKQVLELGCGRGVGLEILLGLGAVRVIGFDLDPEMVALAAKRMATYGDCARVFVGDAAAIAAPDASFNAVVDYGIIHHIPNWPQALCEIARVLKPGGIFYFEDLLKGLISAGPMRALFDHPQATQFTNAEFCAGLEVASLHVVAWRELGAWGVVGQARKCAQRHGGECVAAAERSTSSAFPQPDLSPPSAPSWIIMDERIEHNRVFRTAPAEVVRDESHC